MTVVFKDPVAVPHKYRNRFLRDGVVSNSDTSSSSGSGSVDLSAYLRTSEAASTYLGKSEKAVDSDKLDGNNDTAYLRYRGYLSSILGSSDAANAYMQPTKDDSGKLNVGFANLNNGVFMIDNGGSSSTMIHFQSENSASGLDFWFNYPHGASFPIKYRKQIDGYNITNRRFAGDWVTLIDSLNIGNQSVNHAATADSATKATNADNATKATNADNATKATNADNATKATNADNANACSGNSKTATDFASAKTIELSGDVSGSASGGNGSGWSLETTIGNKKVTNDKLANSSLNLWGNNISLGGSTYGNITIDTGPYQTTLGVDSNGFTISSSRSSNGLTVAGNTNVKGNSVVDGNTNVKGNSVVDGSLRIGGAILSYDSTKKMLSLSDNSGDALNLMATGGMTSYGNEDEGVDGINNFTVKNTLTVGNDNNDIAGSIKLYSVNEGDFLTIKELQLINNELFMMINGRTFKVGLTPV